MKFDNGGAIAQRGFNYQNAVICLVAIRNYKKPNFEIYVEASEDFEVFYDKSYHACIQVKGMKAMSLKKLLKQTALKSGEIKPSIIEKNLGSGSPEDIYKIVVYEFIDSDLKDMQELQDEDEELFEKCYVFSNEQKEKINHPHVDNLSLVITDFKNDKVSARKHLVGEMVEQGISVDDKSDILINHLNSFISEKAEFILKNDRDRKYKRISAEELTPILQKTTSLARFNAILSKFNFNELKNERIKLEKNRIILEYYRIKGIISKQLEKMDLYSISEVDAISKVVVLGEMENFDEFTRYAICISAYCDIVEGIA